MATINYTSDVNVASGAVKVEWPGMAGGDVGQSFDCSGLLLGSIQYFGNFNGGQVKFEASNEASPSTYIDINNKTSAAIDTPPVNNLAALVGAVRPSFVGSGGSVTVAALFVKP